MLCYAVMKSDQPDPDVDEPRETSRSKTKSFRRFRCATKVVEVETGKIWRAENIGLGGIFIGTNSPLPLGAVATISFALPGTEQEIVTQVEVVWTNDRHSREYDPNRPSGMGLSFVDLKADFAEIIRHFLDQGVLTRIR